MSKDDLFNNKKDVCAMPVNISLWDETIPFWDPQADTPNSMTAYLLEDKSSAPAVMVLPGGAYAGRAPHEGEPSAGMRLRRQLPLRGSQVRKGRGLLHALSNTLFH